MAVGFFMGWRGWMGPSEKRFLSKYIVNIAVPCTCITGLLSNLSHDMLLEAGCLRPVIDADGLRELFGLTAIAPFQRWLERMGFVEDGKLTARAGDGSALL